MRKVVEVIPTLSMGGAESMVRDYCLLIDKNAFDICVIVLTEHKGTPIENELNAAGIKVIYLGEKLFGECGTNIFKRLLRKISRYFFFRKEIMCINPDIIHLHLQIGHYMRVLPLRKMNSRLMLSVHNVPERYFSTDKKEKNKYAEYKEVCRLIHTFDMQLITLHDGLSNALRELFDTDRVTTLYNGIMVDRFDPALYNAKEERRKLGIEEEDIVIGHVGSLHPQKNHELILDIFASFYEMDKRARLILVGAGELKEQIVRRIEEYRLNGRVLLLSNRNDIPQLMSTMDIFLFPSRWEGFGNVLIEAQCMNIPCVISDVVPSEVRITDKVHVVELASPIEEWINAIKNALSGENGMPGMNDKDVFDMKQCIRKLESIYNGRV